MDLSSYISFIILITTILFSPGPMTIFLMNSGMHNGLKKTLPALYGASTAYSISIIIYALGVTSIFKNNNLVLEVIRYAGAAYMLYLAYKRYSQRLLISTESNNNSLQLLSSISLYKSGILTGLLNPKAIILFSIVFPRFLISSANIDLNCLILGITFLVLQFLSGCFYTLCGQQLKKILFNPKNQKLINSISALIFVAIAIWLLLM